MERLALAADSGGRRAPAAPCQGRVGRDSMERLALAADSGGRRAPAATGCGAAMPPNCGILGRVSSCITGRAGRPHRKERGGFVTVNERKVREWAGSLLDGAQKEGLSREGSAIEHPTNPTDAMPAAAATP